MAHALCLAHLTLLALPPPRLVEVAAAAGFSHISLRLAPATDQETPWPMAPGSPMLRETLARLQALGVQVNDVELVRLTAHSDVAAWEPLLASAAELGARHLLVAGDTADEAALAERFHALCALGATYGITMALEFMPWRGIATLASAQRVVALAGQGGVVVDAIHLDRSGGTATEVAAIPRNAWAYFQICDAPAQRPPDLETLLFQARSARLPPGHGGLDLVGMLRAIPADSVVSIEAPLQDSRYTPDPVDRARLLRDATLDMLARAGAHG